MTVEMTYAQAAIVTAARSWIGTPYRHQASLRGVGCDCLGLIRGVWREIVGADPEPVPGYSSNWAETSRGEPFLAAAQRHFTELTAADARPGDVLIFRMRSTARAKHAAIMAHGAEGPTFIHAYEGECVVENHLTAAWSRRIAGAFRFPNPVAEV